MTQRHDFLDFDQFKNGKDRSTHNNLELICQPKQIFEKDKVNVFFKSSSPERTELINLLKELKSSGFERISLELTKNPLNARKAIQLRFSNRLPCENHLGIRNKDKISNI